MKVIFQRAWFAAGRLFRKATDPVEVPDELADSLPKTAKVIEEDEAPAPKKAKKKDETVALSELARAGKDS